LRELVREAQANDRARAQGPALLLQQPLPADAHSRSRGARVPLQHNTTLHPHVLRALYATTLVSESVLIHVIARRLGHASIEITNR
jgi:integrase